MNLRGIFASAALAVMLAGAANAQVVPGLDGRWEGAIARSNGSPVRAVFHVATKDGQTTVAFDSPDQGASGLAAMVSRTGENVTFSVPVAQMTYTAKLSADGKTLTGDVEQGGSLVPLIVTQKPASTVATVTGPAVAGLDGTWEGGIVTPMGDIAVALRIARKDGRTTTLMDTPEQGARDVPALTKRDGQKVTVEIPGILASFSAKLSADEKTLVGEWTQSGQHLELTVIRK
jgi:hypothetical protein